MFDGLMFEKPKKKRRKSNEIERLYPCPFHQCSKSYGSEAALKTHIRIKHKTDRHELSVSSFPFIYLFMNIETRPFTETTYQSII